MVTPFFWGHHIAESFPMMFRSFWQQWASFVYYSSQNFQHCSILFCFLHVQPSLTWTTDFKIGFKSVFWLGYSKTWNLFFSNTIFCLFSFFPSDHCPVKRPKSIFRIEGKTTLFKITWHLSESIVSSMCVILPVSPAAKYPKITL